MKKILLTTLTASVVFLSSSLFASAQYYSQNQYTNYQSYLYADNFNNQQLTNCYYTNTYPPTYYGNCQGMTYTYLNNGYGYQANYIPQYNYQTQHQPTYTYPTNTYNNVGSYYTYGYTNGSWRPGYSTNNITNLVNGVFQTANQLLSPNTNCYYQNGYQICY